ncbi:hypothetical protein HELRODRAFT_164666 [Helobdella robusta]|uniref:Uncharacterized protein n=1 Tax=Helobdella robusta TaxID=6412 RepID=T1EVP7_HELRO|nr:hypothetical protein HELRODRAFT_164666 [Helobdella robusta]ESN92594.1 hypothetical protein HELRODRAFT_164666 [Helobdella robusta]
MAVNKIDKKKFGFEDIGSENKLNKLSSKLKGQMFKNYVIVADRVKENKEVEKDKESQPVESISLLDRLFCVKEDKLNELSSKLKGQMFKNSASAFFRKLFKLTSQQELVEKHGFPVIAVNKIDKKKFGFVDIGSENKLNKLSSKLKGQMFKNYVIVADRVKENKEVEKDKESQPVESISLLDRLFCVKEDKLNELSSKLKGQMFKNSASAFLKKLFKLTSQQGLTKFVSKKTLVDVFKKSESVVIPSSKGNALRDVLFIFHKPEEVTRAVKECQGWELGGERKKKSNKRSCRSKKLEKKVTFHFRAFESKPRTREVVTFHIGQVGGSFNKIFKLLCYCTRSWMSAFESKPRTREVVTFHIGKQVGGSFNKSREEDAGRRKFSKLWYKPVSLKTKRGALGYVVEPLGTHENMKC